jgi:hypothetical protein
VIHCLNGNLLRALIGFGRLDNPRVQAPIGWAARAITGQGVERWYASGTSGPRFACAANEHRPCAWGALKELNALARIPPQRRSPLVRQALDQGVEDHQGRWPNRYAYNRKTWVDIEPQGQPSKWVTLRACTVLGAAYG